MKKTIVLDVYIISDHPLVAQQLKAILSADPSLRARLERERSERLGALPEVFLIDTTSTLQPVEELVWDLASRYDGSKIVRKARQDPPGPRLQDPEERRR